MNAEKNNVKMAEDLLKVIHRFDGGPVPLDDTISRAALIYKGLEMQLNKVQDKRRKKELGKKTPPNTLVSPDLICFHNTVS